MERTSTPPPHSHWATCITEGSKNDSRPFNPLCGPVFNSSQYCFQTCVGIVVVAAAAVAIVVTVAAAAAVVVIAAAVATAVAVIAAVVVVVVVIVYISSNEVAHSHH